MTVLASEPRQAARPACQPAPTLVCVLCPACDDGSVDFVLDSAIRGADCDGSAVCGHCRGYHRLTIRLVTYDGRIYGYVDELEELCAFADAADASRGAWEEAWPPDLRGWRDEELLELAGVAL